MLIQVFQRTRQGLKKVNEYYWWRVPVGYEMSDEARAAEEQIAKMPCPGCGRTLTRLKIRFEHQCPGTLTEHPVTPGRTPRISLKSEREAKLAEYMRKNPNVVVSDGPV